MAKLERIESSVRLKPASSFIWGPVQANEDLYRKDSLQTAPNGGASVRFKDGTLLEVGENSLIIVDSIENLSLGFLRGSAVLRTRSGDSRITLDKNGKTRIEALPIRLISPEAFSHYFTEGAKATPIEFAWELKPRVGQPLPDGVNIQISSDRSFRSGTKVIEVSSAATSASASLPPGRYYWRVFSNGHALGEATQFIVDGVSGVTPVFPEASDKVPVFGADASVQFRWVPQGASENEDLRVSHRLQIASDPSFRNVLHSQQIAASAGSSVISDHQGLFASGERYWRIVSQYESSHSRLIVHSPTEQFAIDKIADVPIELTSPGDSEAIRLDRPGPAGKQGGIHFSWHSDVDGVGYRWQLRSGGATGQQASPIQSIDTRGAKTYAWSSARAGTYQWRVQAVYQDRVVGQSSWKTFLASQEPPISLRAPVDGKAFRYWTEPPNFNFSWSVDPKARSYVLEVASDVTFKGAANARTSVAELASHEIHLGSGTQFWRVSALDANGQVINSSASRRLDYGVFPPLRAPASAKPDPGAVLNPLEMDHDPAISWAPVADAQGYEVTIKQGDHVVAQQVVKETRSGMKGLQAGKYAYTIRAIDRLQRKGEPLGDRTFEINYGQPLEAPEALSPEVQ